MGEALLDVSVNGDRLALVAGGSWTAERAGELEPLIDAVTRRSGETTAVDIRMGGVDRIDTFGAWLLERLLRAFASAGREVRVLDLPERWRDLVAKAHQVNRSAEVPARTNPLLDALARLGKTTTEVAYDLLMIVQMFGAMAVVLLRVIARPWCFRFTAMVHHLDRVGWRATPVIALMTFLLGCIIAQQGLFHFRRFGADLYVVDMVGILTLREIGVLMVAVMVAGRSGSAYTAELGSMKMREEIDALRTMGLDPLDVLVLPRLVALVVAMPILAFLGSMAALYGAGLVCSLYGGISPEIFLARLRYVISFEDFLVGMLKAPFMGLVIGIVATVEGLQVSGSTESLGLKTTASVVKAIFLMVVLDGLFAIFFASIGM